MGLSIRFYLFAEDGLQSISQRVMLGLIRGKDAMPQYAGTKQKVADVILENEGKKPLRIERVQGSFLTFDDKGQVHKDLVASGFAALETGMALAEALKNPQTKIVDLTPKLNREKWERENRWTPTKDDLDAIADDIWRRKDASQPRIERAQGIVPKPPKVTYEAKEAIREIRTSLISIANKLQWLSEPALKGPRSRRARMPRSKRTDLYGGALPKRLSAIMRYWSGGARDAAFGTHTSRY